MRNLLPEHNQKRIRNEYYKRLATVALAFAAVAAMIGAAALLPAYVTVLSKVDALRAQVAVSEQSIARRADEPLSAEVLRGARVRAEILRAQEERFRLGPIMRGVVEQAQAGIVLTELSYDRQGDSGVVTLSGDASSRDVLLAYKEALETLPLFESIELPVSNLAAERDIEFTLRAHGMF